MTNQWPPTLGFVVWCFVGHWSLVISVSANPPTPQRPLPFIVHRSSFIVSPTPRTVMPKAQ
jgi:hypothetical protein